MCFEPGGALLAIVAFAMNWRSRLTGIATGDQAIFVRRATFIADGGYAPISLMEDIELSGRLKRRHGAPLCLRDRVTVSDRRWRTRGILSTVALMWRLRFAYLCGTDPALLALRYPHVRRHD